MSRHGFDWIEKHLTGSEEAKRKVPVQYFVTGAQEWRSTDVFPPPTTPSTLYLYEGGKLARERASTTSTMSTFTYDPRNPTPTIGSYVFIKGGSVDDTVLAKRSDVLVFDTAPLEADLEFCGNPIIELAHTTNGPFADVFVRVSEVDTKGKSRNIAETYKRLDLEHSEDAELKLSLNHCAHRFLRGKIIKLVVAGGYFPQYARNHGVENRDMNGTELHAVEHTVHHSEHRVSKVILPIIL